MRNGKRVIWGSAFALALLVAPASMAGAAHSDSDLEGAPSSANDNIEQTSPDVDEGLVERIANAHPYPETPEQRSDQRTDAQTATWNQEITDYWINFPYDEVASAYGCEIRDLEVGEAEDGTPNRSLVVGDCPTSEHTEITLETLDQINTSSAEVTQLLAETDLVAGDQPVQPTNQNCGTSDQEHIQFCHSINTTTWEANSHVSNASYNENNAGIATYYHANVECESGNRQTLNSTGLISLAPRETILMTYADPTSTWFRTTWAGDSTVGYCSIV